MKPQKYTATGVEEVYDGFDDLDCRNHLGPVEVTASSPQEAEKLAYEKLDAIAKENRKDQGSVNYMVLVEEIKDESGQIVMSKNTSRNIPGY